MKVIYIVGGGRSGSTLMGIVLGNGDQMFHAGELLKYFEYNAVPRGFTPESKNYKFWQKVDAVFKQQCNIAKIQRLKNLIKYFEDHYFLLINFLGLIPKKYKKLYKEVNQELFNSIVDVTNKNIIIDSSKYVNRCFSLYKYLDADFKVIYLQRNFKDVVNSFSKPDIEQPRSGYIKSFLYYTLVNMSARLILTRIPKKDYIKVRYENLITDPGETLKKIENQFSIDLNFPLDRIQNNEELETGYIFEGNRIRLNNTIIFRKKSITIIEKANSIIK